MKVLVQWVFGVEGDSCEYSVVERRALSLRAVIGRDADEVMPLDEGT